MDIQVVYGECHICNRLVVMIILVLQEETQEYLQEAKLKELVGKYSQFINFPIYLYASKEVDVPLDDEEPAAADTDDDVSEGAEDDVDDEDGNKSNGLSPTPHPVTACKLCRLRQYSGG